MKILIVDDSKFSQLIIEKQIREILPDVEFIFASDGKEGLEKYAETKPDYSFIDLLMPVISGQELIRQIREQDAQAKLFVISADVQDNVKDEMATQGILGFFNKPFDQEKARIVYNTIKGKKCDE